MPGALASEEKPRVAVLEIVGEIDSRTAHEFEKKLVDLLGSGTRLFVIDFRK